MVRYLQLSAEERSKLDCLDQEWLRLINMGASRPEIDKIKNELNWFVKSLEEKYKSSSD